VSVCTVFSSNDWTQHQNINQPCLPSSEQTSIIPGTYISTFPSIYVNSCSIGGLLPTLHDIMSPSHPTAESFTRPKTAMSTFDITEDNIRMIQGGKEVDKILWKSSESDGEQWHATCHSGILSRTTYGPSNSPVTTSPPPPIPHSSQRGRRKKRPRFNKNIREIISRPVTSLILLLNTLVFLVVRRTSLSQFGFPSGVGGRTPEYYVKTYGYAYSDVVNKSERYRMVSSCFIHVSPFHLGFNMMTLWSVGGELEELLGPGVLLETVFVLIFCTKSVEVSVGYLKRKFFVETNNTNGGQPIRAIGFSGILFAIVVLQILTLPPEKPICPLPSVLEKFCFDTYTFPLLNLRFNGSVVFQAVVIQVLVKNASFDGHLCGIIAGYGLGWVGYGGEWGDLGVVVIGILAVEMALRDFSDEEGGRLSPDNDSTLLLHVLQVSLSSMSFGFVSPMTIVRIFEAGVVIVIRLRGRGRRGRGRGGGLVWGGVVMVVYYTVVFSYSMGRGTVIWSSGSEQWPWLSVASTAGMMGWEVWFVGVGLPLTENGSTGVEELACDGSGLERIHKAIIDCSCSCTRRRLWRERWWRSNNNRRAPRRGGEWNDDEYYDDDDEVELLQQPSSSVETSGRKRDADV